MLVHWLLIRRGWLSTGRRGAIPYCCAHFRAAGAWDKRLDRRRRWYWWHRRWQGRRQHRTAFRVSGLCNCVRPSWAAATLQHRLSQGRTSALDDTAGSGGAASNSWPCSWRSQTAPASERLRCRRARQELGCPHLPSPKVGRCPGRACSLAQWRAAFAVIAIQLLGKRKSHLS